ncbi:MAG: hypothetical protein LBU88_07525 [Treponema sp.]|jgi:hypothetical protein|nr:hypothetical protein [Treponema sp.]
MRHTFLTILLLVFLFFSGGLLGAAEVEISGGVNFLTHHPDKTRAYSDSAMLMKEFQPYPFGFGSLIIKNEINDNLAYNINLVRDNILRNNIEGLFIAKTDYFSFQIGPFFGMPDVLESPFFGLLSNIKLSYPGVVFLDLSGSVTLSQEIEFLSDHTRETLGAKLGFWLPNAIPSVSASYKKFKKIDPFLTVHDTLIRYQFSIDFYSKKHPATFCVDAGYQILTRFYDNDITETYTDELNLFFAGFELRWQMSNSTKVILGAELPVYIIATAPMTAPLFYRMPKATFGFVFSRD